MDSAQLAAALAAASEGDRAAIVTAWTGSVDVEVAWALRARYLDASGRDAIAAQGARAALRWLADYTGDAASAALARWTTGLAVLQLDGRPDAAIEHLDAAARQFAALGQPATAAATQVAKLYALAILGRYEEAVACGMGARDVFVAHGDVAAAGRIEQNLGNIYARQDRYDDAERYFRSALTRFTALDDQQQIAQVENCLATALTAVHRFREATVLYEQALARVDAAGMEVTLAEIESNLGCLAQFQGGYDRALDFLERSRRRYATLQMQHRVACIEQDIADTYLELNLAAEAADIYARIVPTFAELGMRAEQAAAQSQHARACVLLGEIETARRLIAQARSLYEAEGNRAGEATAALVDAQICYADGDFEAALAVAETAHAPLAASGLWRRVLLARWLSGEATRNLGRLDEAQSIMESVLDDARAQVLPQIEHRCLASMGLIAAARGAVARSEHLFVRAIDIIENLRAPLPADEFRTAFIADKLTPYAEMVRLCLDAHDPPRTAEALRYVERSRSRALADMIGGLRPLSRAPRDAFEADLMAELENLREELNWFYSQINHLPDTDARRAIGAVDTMHAAVRIRETRIRDIVRQLHLDAQGAAGGTVQTASADDLGTLRRYLAADTALVEYYILDGEVLAFVLTEREIDVCRHLCRLDELEPVLSQLRFQLETLRHGQSAIRAHLGQLTRRSLHYLSLCYDLVLRPIEDMLGHRRLVVIPHRALHYVPFHALYDGAAHVVQRREVSYAPSAAVLLQCLEAPRRALERALLLGVSDAQTPHVRDEVRTLAPLFPAATALIDGQATLAALRDLAPSADLVHLACHGVFRPDNPLFSSLRLSDGWLTVSDAYDLRLNCELVTLSACETGMSQVQPGDELMGLARGFLTAGAPSLLVSLWPVDDASTAELMGLFYRHLGEGASAASALRQAQCALIGALPHPYYWSPFVLMGRW